MLRNNGHSDDTTGLEAGGQLSSAHKLETAAPVRLTERIPVIDVLRGFALLGILAVNIEDFAGPEAMHDIPVGLAKAAFVGWHAPLDITILAFKWLFIEGKMRALFSMLYGAGCLLLLERIEHRVSRSEARTIFFRRNAFLLLFGIIHGTLLWAGDILSQYALCGLIVPYALRKLSARKLMAIGATILLFTALVGVPEAADNFNASAEPGVSNVVTAFNRWNTPHSPAQRAQEARSDQALLAKLSASAAKDAQAVRHMSILEVIKNQTVSYCAFLKVLIDTGFISEIFGTIILGMGLYKIGFLTGSLRTRDYAIIACAGYAITFPIVIIGTWQSAQHGFGIPETTLWLFLPYTFGQIPGALANAALIMLMAQQMRFNAVATRLASVGRMAFTNYIMTTVVCQGIFVWSPTPLFGKLEYYQYLYVVFAVWLAILTASPIWLSRFRFGPLEWMWRSLTYGRMQALKL